jgi:hypothetical protein
MAGLSVAVDVAVDRPPDDVWRYVVEGYFDHHSSWDPAIVEMVKLTPGEIAVGTRGREVRRFGAKQAADFEVTALVRPERFSFRNTSGPFAVERSYRLRPADRGTVLSFSFEMRPKGVMHLLFPLLRNTIAAQVRANIARIPTLVTADV